MGILPSGRGVSMGLIDIVRITEERVVEHWSLGDTLGMMQELVSSLGRDSRRKPALPYALIQPDSSRTSLILLNMYRCTQAHNHPS
jgi:SnoaL-like polyketide cyclase